MGKRRTSCLSASNSIHTVSQPASTREPSPANRRQLLSSLETSFRTWSYHCYAESYRWTDNLDPAWVLMRAALDAQGYEAAVDVHVG